MILMRGLFPALLGMNQLISRAASFLSFYEMMIQNIDYGSKAWLRTCTRRYEHLNTNFRHGSLSYCSSLMLPLQMRLYHLPTGLAVGEDVIKDFTPTRNRSVQRGYAAPVCYTKSQTRETIVLPLEIAHERRNTDGPSMRHLGEPSNVCQCRCGRYREAFSRGSTRICDD